MLPCLDGSTKRDYCRTWLASFQRSLHSLALRQRFRTAKRRELRRISRGGGGQSGTGGAGATGGASGQSGTGGTGGDGGACNITKSPSEDACLVSDQYAIFVSPTGIDGAAGTQVAPLKSITEAVTKAAGSKVILVCNGTFDEHVKVSGGARIYGGFACDSWAYQPTTVPSIAPTTTGYALEIESPSGNIVIEDVGFVSKDGAAGAESSITAFVKNSTSVMLRRVQLQAGKGANGSAGSLTNFTTFPNPLDLRGNDANLLAGGAAKSYPTCPGGGSTTGGKGGNGGTPTGGALGLPDYGGGLGGMGSAAICDIGKIGNAGPDGDDGKLSALGSLSQVGWVAGDGGNGMPGSPGQGGGGGGGDGLGGGGSGAAGGCGGAGAKGGMGGGSSIALLSFASTVTVESSQLSASDAGNGGAGVAGQAGMGLGGNGGQGAKRWRLPRWERRTRRRWRLERGWCRRRLHWCRVPRSQTHAG